MGSGPGSEEKGGAQVPHLAFHQFLPSPQPPAALPGGTVGPDVFTPKTQQLFLEIVWEGLPTAAILHRCIPWGPETPWGGSQVKIVFLIVMRHSLSFSFSFSDKTHALDFSRWSMTRGIATG